MKNAFPRFNGHVVIIGCGSLGRGVLPLLIDSCDLSANQISIITADERGRDVANAYGIPFHIIPLTPENYRDVLKPMLKKGDFLLNLSVDVSSVALVELAQEVGAMYLDTCIEPWPGFYTNPELSASQRSNYALRESALALKNRGQGKATAIMAHGANPGLVSHFVKQALLNIAADTGRNVQKPTTKDEWAKLAMDLGIKTIHIAERDTQRASQPKARGEFVNTWSIDGFVSEGCQPAELGWGTHEKGLPHDGQQHDFGCDSAIYLKRPGASTRVRTWTPMEGAFHGFLITHNESISIADFLTVRDDGKPVYRPTVHYAYHPCDDAVVSLHEFAGKNWDQQEKQRLLMNEIVSGTDELGVLLMGHDKCAYWYGSQLSIEETRRLVPHNNATSLQVVATVLGAMAWAIENPTEGVVEAEDLDFERVLSVANPYLGNVVGKYTDWTPLEGRGTLFPEALDTTDPWQFSNFRVN